LGASCGPRAQHLGPGLPGGGGGGAPRRPAPLLTANC
jgi:hypothetical protein